MAKDPYRYFRVEARELLEGLIEGIRLLDGGDELAETTARMLRLAHTLKGAARVVKQPQIAEVAHQLETLLGEVRERGGSLQPEQERGLWGLIEAGSSLIKRLDAIAPGPSPGAALAPISAPAPAPLQTVRVELPALDALLGGVLQVGTQLGILRKEAEGALRLGERARRLEEALGGPARSAAASGAGPLVEALQEELGRHQRVLERGVERLEAELSQVAEVAQGLRLVPARTVFSALELAVRDAAGALGKAATFEARGGEVRLDADVLLSVRDALTHVVRNAVTHGLEPPAERERAGKASRGTVRLTVERRQDRVTFRCEDDGRGIDAEAVRAAAVARGRLRPDEARAHTYPQLIDLLLQGGLSTAQGLTELAGRGIGLDVARATAQRLKGSLALTSEPGRGTAVELCVPLSIASLRGLLVEAEGAVAALPLEAVRQTVRIRAGALIRSKGREGLWHEGRSLPFVPLARALGTGPGAGREAWTAVVVGAGDREAAVGVDRLLGTATLVVRSLPACAAANPMVLGASLDAEGQPRLVLDPHGLLDAVDADEGPPAAATRASPEPILVVDDSVTSRMLEKTLLESAGYRVELAVCAEEALEKARRTRFSLFLVDVEMPGMDGFELIATTRADPSLSEIPAVLITSRDGEADRARGRAVGARGYLVKGELDQGALLALLRELVGEP